MYKAEVFVSRRNFLKCKRFLFLWCFLKPGKIMVVLGFELFIRYDYKDQI